MNRDAQDVNETVIFLSLTIHVCLLPFLNTMQGQPLYPIERGHQKPATEPRMITSLGQTSCENISALLISPHDIAFECLWGIFHEQTWKLEVVQSCRQAYSALGKHAFPVILCDHNLPDGNWKMIREHLAATPAQLIVCSRLADERQWIEVLESGGYDLLGTPFRREDAIRVIRGAYFQWLIEGATMSQRENAKAVSGSARQTHQVMKRSTRQWFISF